MEFFNCKSNKQSKAQNLVLSVDIKHIKSVKSFPFTVMLNNITQIELFSLINKNPLYVSLVGRHSSSIAGVVDEEKTGLSSFGKFVIEQLENFNIIVDLGRLNTKSITESLKIVKKRVLVTDVVLSSFCDLDALDREIEEELVKRKSLLVLNLDKCCLQTLAESILNFISIYGENYLALSTNKGNKRFLEFLNKMQQKNVDKEVIEKITFKNAQEFFSSHLIK